MYVRKLTTALVGRCNKFIVDLNASKSHSCDLFYSPRSTVLPDCAHVISGCVMSYSGLYDICVYLLTSFCDIQNMYVLLLVRVLLCRSVPVPSKADAVVWFDAGVDQSSPSTDCGECV